VIAKSFARIHLANLINFGIIPLTFKNGEDYNNIDLDDELQLDTNSLDSNTLSIKNLTKGIEIELQHTMIPSEIEYIRAGGKLAYISKSDLEKN